ncbi:MAG: hypothetical protein QOF60_2208 [Actinomycetota bacterium]|nr:hypothetical protein [Actinomycetota bacterium]
MTKPGEGDRGGKCRWCGRLLPPAAATGRPRQFCRPVCRQRDFEARQRSAEVGLSEADLVIARRELDALSDQLYVLETAIEDVERDLATSPTKQDYADAVLWLLQAAKPLVARSWALPTKE